MELVKCALEGCEEYYTKRPYSIYCSSRCTYRAKGVHKYISPKDNMKQCSVCGEEKNLTDFYKDKKTYDGYMYKCSDCAKTYHSEWRRKNDGNAHSTASRYSLGIDKYKEMLESRAGVCDACGRVVDRLNVDHNHACCPGKTSCGKCVRGLLCSTCNFALGSVQDNVWRLQELIRYLEENNG